MRTPLVMQRKENRGCVISSITRKRSVGMPGKMKNIHKTNHGIMLLIVTGLEIDYRL